MFVKICGITRLEDAQAAVAHGATALGFIFWPGSPRYVTAEQAAAIVAGLPPTVTAVGVFVDEPVDGICEIAARSGITAVQLHGDEPPAHAEALGWPVIRSATLERLDEIRHEWPAGTTLLLDATDPVRRGGTGRTIDWSRAAAAARTARVVLAGGLTPANVAEAIATVRPFGVDVSSGVESAPGVKDREKLARFLERALAGFDGLSVADRAAAGDGVER